MKRAKHALDATLAKDFPAFVTNDDLAEFDRALSREIRRIELVIESGDAAVAQRQMIPLLRHLKRIRAGARNCVGAAI